MLLLKLCWFLLSFVTNVRCQIDGNIFNGEYAAIEKFPHSARLGISCKGRSWLCGASILNQCIALTAAHCLNECEGTANVVVNVGSSMKYEGVTSRSADMYKVHKKNSTANDIALIRTRKPFTFSNNIRRLAIMLNPPAVKQAKLAGWGITDDVRYQPSTTLQQLDQTLLSRAKCVKVIGKIREDCFCATNKDPSKYAAVGDSGSALVINDYIGIGLVSFKREKYSKHIIVYTNISYHYEWITTNAKSLACKKLN